MDNTPFSNKVEILNDFYMDYAGSEEYDEFILLNDLGFPAAVLTMMGAVTLTDIGKNHIEETWQALCEMLGVDHMGDYENLYSLMEFANE